MASGQARPDRPARGDSAGPDRPGGGDGPGGAVPPMVGREDELELLRGRLADPSARLLTMTGPAGVGKTRLALALTAEAVPEAGYLDLAPYARPGAAPEAL